MEFDVHEGLRAQQALREELKLGPERFPLPAFVGMLSDEIQKMRESGRTDSDVADVIERAIGKRVDPADIARFYAPEEERIGHGEG